MIQQTNQKTTADDSDVNDDVYIHCTVHNITFWSRRQCNTEGPGVTLIMATSKLRITCDTVCITRLTCQITRCYII